MNYAAVYSGRFGPSIFSSFKVPTVLVSIVEGDHQWFKAKIGFPNNSTSRDQSFCAFTLSTDTPEILYVSDATKDDRFKENPLVNWPFCFGLILFSYFLYPRNSCGGYGMVQNHVSLIKNLLLFYFTILKYITKTYTK